MEERRRSTRVTGILPIILSGIDMDGQRFREVTWTISLNMHGAKATTVKKLAKDDHVSIQCYPTDRPTDSRVTWADAVGKGYVFGFEMAKPKNLWGLTNPPKDWEPYPRADRALPGHGAAKGATPAQPHAAAEEGAAAATPAPKPPSPELAAANTNASVALRDHSEELNQLLERIQQALGVTRESLKVYQEMESESARLVAGACERIHKRIATELEGSFAATSQALSARANETLETSREGLNQMRSEHQGQVEEMAREFERRLSDAMEARLEVSEELILERTRTATASMAGEAQSAVEKVRASIEATQKDFEESEKRLDEHARTAAQSIREQSQTISQALRESAERTKTEIADHLAQTRERWRQQVQEEMDSVLGAYRHGSNNLMQDFSDRLVEAAQALSRHKAQGAVPGAMGGERASTLPS